MPAQTVTKLIKSPAPMYTPAAWRSKGGLHVATTQNTEHRRQLRCSCLQSTQYSAFSSDKHQNRSTRARIHQNNSNTTRAFSKVEGEANLKSIYGVWWSIAEDGCSWGRWHSAKQAYGEGKSNY